jgi:uncharacterized membrane protein YebE (DUF533 family)
MAVGMAATRSRLRSAAAAGVRVARALYSRWRLLPQADRDRIAPLAEDAKDKALAVRGAADGPLAEAELRTASETLAAALVETAEADPEVDEEEVRRLREDLRRELDRLASADVKASRTREASQPPG